jgi:dephospho-CoA kinase
MRRVALTGGIATGKSHIRALFERLGVPTIDADVIARDVVAGGTPGLEAVAARFGREILDEAGTLDRKKLASVVFADPAARHDLEQIIHPSVRRAIDAWFASLDAAVPVAVADIPLLYETGRERDFEVVIVAACSPGTQIKRVMARDSINEHEARPRLDAQLPIEEKIRRAQYVIRTEGTVEETERQVRRVHDALRGQ